MKYYEPYGQIFLQALPPMKFLQEIFKNSHVRSYRDTFSKAHHSFKANHVPFGGSYLPMLSLPQQVRSLLDTGSTPDIHPVVVQLTTSRDRFPPKGSESEGKGDPLFQGNRSVGEIL